VYNHCCLHNYAAGIAQVKQGTALYPASSSNSALERKLRLAAAFRHTNNTQNRTDLWIVTDWVRINTAIERLSLAFAFFPALFQLFWGAFLQAKARRRLYLYQPHLHFQYGTTDRDSLARTFLPTSPKCVWIARFLDSEHRFLFLLILRAYGVNQAHFVSRNLASCKSQQRQTNRHTHRRNHRANARLRRRVLHRQPVAVHRIVRARLTTCRHHQQLTACMPIPPVLIVPKRIPSRQVILHTRPTPTAHRSVIQSHRHTATTYSAYIPILLLVLHISSVPLPHTRTITIVSILIRHLHTASPVVPLYLHQPTFLVVSKHTRIAARLLPTRQSALRVPRKTVHLTRPHILHRRQPPRHLVVAIHIPVCPVQRIVPHHHRPTAVQIIPVVPTVPHLTRLHTRLTARLDKGEIRT
jgi:hypothetical protein